MSTALAPQVALTSGTMPCHSLQPPAHHRGRHRRGERRAALRLPDPGPGSARVRAGLRPAAPVHARGGRHQRDRRLCTSPASRSASAPADGCGRRPNSFVASANCARYCGADVDFVDIDPATRNLSVPRLRAKLEQASAQGRLPAGGGSGRLLRAALRPAGDARARRPLWLPDPRRRLARRRRQLSAAGRSAAHTPTSRCSASTR